MSRFLSSEFYYRLGWRSRSVQPGSHATRTSGGSADFRGYVPFLENTNPRRIDLRASLRTFPQQLMVRAYYERGAIAVYAILDLSASMRFSGKSNKTQLMADITASIAWSAQRNGDGFGMVACDDEMRSDLFEAPSYRRGIADEVYEKLINISSLAQVGASALPRAVKQLRKKRSLVFLISDFHLDERLLKETLASLSPHDVVPIVLWDSAEYRDIPNWGWARVRDLETGDYQSLFLRPSLVKRIKESYASRRAEIISSCLLAGTRMPFFIEDHFDVEALTRHMLEAS
ncbi:DUF58 domain-containing protein [Methylotenera mobilis]|uniref:DUF58 domain-containing protein n=1 Tax=Methylotenera mobilis TaxID=359408 RepID=UPI00037C83F0|nr:DUF58 domain-containing protein [Methylotenera mobilis]